MDYEVIGGTYDLLINKTLAAAMQQNLLKTGGVVYSETEKAFATKLQASFAYKAPPIDNAANIDSLMENKDGLGSTDVGDVSWNVPTIGMTAATWVPGTPGTQLAGSCLRWNRNWYKRHDGRSENNGTYGD